MTAWRDQVALVTGGARGIGQATARLLAQRGAAVCLNYATHADAADGLASEIAAGGGRAISVMADVADPSAVEAMVARTEKELGPVTILVNNAGVSWRGTLDTYDPASGLVWAVMFFGPLAHLSGLAGVLTELLMAMLRYCGWCGGA